MSEEQLLERYEVFQQLVKEFLSVAERIISKIENTQKPNKE
jgi:hypothetical protein